MSKRRKPKPQPAVQKVGIQIPAFQAAIPNFRLPIPVQPGDQVVGEWIEEDGQVRPRFDKILRDGVQIWP